MALFSCIGAASIPGISALGTRGTGYTGLRVLQKLLCGQHVDDSALYAVQEMYRIEALPRPVVT